MPRLMPERAPAGPALAQQTVRETLQNVKQQAMQMITPIYNPKVKRYQDPGTGRFVANPNVERVEKPVGVEKKGKEVELVRNVESVQDVSKGTVKIDYDLAKEYIRDVESKTGLKLHKSQIEKLKDTLRENKYEKMTPLETLKHRNTFNSVKNKLIKEWEENTRQTWPRYTEEIYDKKGRLARDIGQPYDAHHIIENNFGGPHEWWNIHPAKFPDEHQAGIHGKGAPSNKLFPRR